MITHTDLVHAVQQLAMSRFPDGEQMAGGVLVESDEILTSVCLEAPVDSAGLCAETGAFCEAHKLGQRVVASVCVWRRNAACPFRVLLPCGMCQERLAFWGLDVEVLVPGEVVGEWRAVALRELHPFDWRRCSVRVHDVLGWSRAA